MLLMRALSQFGAGLGSHMSRRRQGKQDEEFANQMYPDTTPEEMMNPQDTQLIQALTGNTMPGMAGMISGAGMQGNQMMRASQQSGQANQQAAGMRSMMKDPRAAAMMKQAMIQQQFTPKVAKAPVSLGGGRVGVYDQKTGQYNIKDYGEKTNPKDRWMTVDGNVYDRETVVDGAPKLAIEGVSDNGRVVTVGVGDQQSTAWYDPDTDELRMLGGPMSRGKSEVTTITPADMTKATQSKTESDIFDISNKMGRLTQLEEMEFDPAWLQIEGKLKNKGLEFVDYSKALTAGADWLIGKKTMEQAWGDYENWQNFSRASYENLNQTILEITGAQMNQEEVPRIKGQIPNVDDPPKKFWSKYNGVKDYLFKLDGRIKKFRKQGIVPAGVRDPDKYGVNEFGKPISYEEIAMKSGPEVAYQAWAADQIASGSMGEYANNYSMKDEETEPKLDEDGLLPGSKIVGGGGR